MAYLNVNIPTIYAKVKKEYLYDLDKKFNKESVDCVIFGMASITGKSLLFHCLLPNGACYWRLPISAFFQKSFHRTEVPDMSVDELELWNCFSYYPSVTEFDFLGGSMGAVVGKRFLKAVDHAIENNIPLISFSTSGGARMQESMISLFQMGKTASAVKVLKNKKIPFISVLVDPCYGGVTASLAMLGDLIIAEPNARIGFSGKRVIQDTVKEDLPKDFQTAEKQLEKGFVDKIIDRRELRNFISKILKILD